MKRFVALLILPLAACSTTEQWGGDPFVFLDPEDTLQIEFSYSADPRYQMDAPSLADSIEDDRRENFEEAIAALLPLVNLPMDYVVLDSRERPREGQPVLRIHALRWEVNDLGQVEAVVRATVESEGDRNTLGSFRHEESGLAFASEDRRDQLFVATMTRSLSEMFSELMEHFTLPGELHEEAAP